MIHQRKRNVMDFGLKVVVHMAEDVNLDMMKSIGRILHVYWQLRLDVWRRRGSQGRLS